MGATFAFTIPINNADPPSILPECCRNGSLMAIHFSGMNARETADLSEAGFIKTLKACGCSMTGQTAEIAPAAYSRGDSLVRRSRCGVRNFCSAFS